MILKKLATLTICTAILALSPIQAEEKSPPTPTPLPQQGSLSSTLVGGKGGMGAAGQWGGTATDDTNKGAPFQGSVSRVTSGTWLVKITNSSKDSFSASLELQQFGERGNKIKSDYFSVSLAPKQVVERKFSASSSSRNANLQLQGWKKTTKEPPATPTPQSTPDQKSKATNAMKPKIKPLGNAPKFK